MYADDGLVYVKRDNKLNPNNHDKLSAALSKLNTSFKLSKTISPGYCVQ